MKTSRGSEWRKWDLHLHTPETKLANKYKSEDSQNIWDSYCEKIENSDVEVFGITDYFAISNYFSFKDKFNKKFPESKKIFFPNIEFRITDKNKDGDHIQFHIIFSDDEETVNKIENFLTRLPLISTDNLQLTSKYCTDKDLSEIGYKKAMVAFEDTVELLKKNFSNKEFIVVGLSSGYGSLRPGKDDNRGSEYAKEIDKKCRAFFGSSKDTDFYLNKKEGRNQFNLKPKPVFNASDAHSFEDLNNKLGKSYTKLDESSKVCDYSEVTWVKADKTFDGLLQVLNEPENRVFIGEFPNVIEKIKTSPSKYVNKVKINQIDGYNETDGIWFRNQEIVINPELTVIIGNKGKGKSAITDVIGLCGNSHRQKDFSFLNAKKFKKKDLAKNFNAELIWQDGNIKTLNLNDLVDDTSIEKVKYIPQNFFEELCNNIDDDRAFRKEVNDVVFRHLDETDRLGKSSFEEFINEKQSNIDQDIKFLKDNISEINKEIVDKQIKTRSGYINNLKSKLNAREIELDNIKKNPPLKNYDESIVDNLEENPNFKKAEDLALKIENLEKERKGQLNFLTTINSKLLKLTQLKERINTHQNLILKFIEDESLILNEFQIPADKVFVQKPDYDLKEIDKKIFDFEKQKLRIELNEGKIVFRSSEHSGIISDESELLFNKIKKITEEQNLLLDGLEGNMKSYQDYLKLEKDWKDKQNNILGSADGSNIETINYYKNEIQKCENNYVNDLKILKNRRLKYSLEIYKKKKEIIDIYLFLKQNVKKIIDNNGDKIKEYNINIDASFDINSFTSNFLDFINKSIAGQFYGNNESVKKINDLINSKDINSEESFKEFLIEIESLFENNGDQSQSPFNQLKQNKEPLDFYNFVFELEYLKEKYELKLDGKSIEQLSPGERGAALIVFYLLLDSNDIPLIIDQPEDNLDNHSVYKILVPFIKDAKKRRQIMIVTHNPNLAIVSDAELIIHVNIDKENKNKFSYISGAIEDKEINTSIINILEGTEPAFIKRKDKYGL